MAGSYPDVPGYRFAYDADGTSVVYHNLGTGLDTAQSQTILQVVNSETVGSVNSIAPGAGGGFGAIVFFFPEPRNITGILINLAALTINSVQWSNDTITGLDGAWNTIGSITTYSSADRALFRTNINPASVTGATAFRINTASGNSSSRIYNVHLYGSIAGSESPDRLRIVDISDNDIAAQLDFGDIYQRSNVTKQFKVTNNSSTQTANNITVGLSAQTNASPSLIGQFQISTDNVAYANAINIGNLAPGASSGTLYVRDTVASNAQLSVWSARITASAVSWS